jgi:protein gp37
VFCGSLCDIFEDHGIQKTYGLSDTQQWRIDLMMELIPTTPHLDWLLLTKRPHYVYSMTPWAWWNGDGWPDNVWIGTSVEDQEQADARIPHLLKIPARIRWLSCEPLLGPIDLWRAGATESDGAGGERGGQVINFTRGLVDWVIVGGESGPNKRPMDLVWARDIRDQCQAADVPFFFKQVDKVQEIPDDLMIREFPNE